MKRSGIAMLALVAFATIARSTAASAGEAPGPGVSVPQMGPIPIGPPEPVAPGPPPTKIRREVQPADRSGGGEREWYGGPALLVDGLALAGVIAGEGYGFDPLVVLSVGSYVLAGPINHLRRHGGRRAVGSLFMRATAAVLVGVGVHATRSCEAQGFDCDSMMPVAMGALVFGVTSAALLTILDDGPMSVERRPRAAAPATLVPSIVVGSNTSLVGLAGTF